MKKFTMFATLALVMVFALTSFAGDLTNVKMTVGNSVLHGGSANFAKAAGDTIDLMGPAGSTYVGDFQAGWNGWTSVDVTQPTVTHWNVSNYNQADPLNHAAWCGDINIASCIAGDPAGGYANSWIDLMWYKVTVGNPASNAICNVTATMQIDSEPGYDYVYLSQQNQGEFGYTDANSWTDKSTVAINETLTFLPTNYIGGQAVVVFRFLSDGGWSDGDCSWPTAGACQIDDITVTTTQTGEATIVSFTDFESGFGDWAPTLPIGVGDFSQLWSNLEDNDPCNTNYSQQVAFIDDGIIVPGTGPTVGINWLYGPNGYTVATTGGLAGPDSHIQVDIHSPVMTWPSATVGADPDGILFRFDGYAHEDLDADAPGIFYTWGVRSADTDGSAGTVQALADQAFLDRNFVYYAPNGVYQRTGDNVTDLMNPGRDEMQLRLGVYELGWVWGFAGNDGYPAPYFDNVSVKVFPYIGPGMSTRELDIAQDNFPTSDALNLSALGTMSVRFDMANNISLAADLRNDPGDSIIFTIVPIRSGAVLAGTPEMHYILDPNLDDLGAPVFGPAERTSGFANSGVVLGQDVFNSAGVQVADKYSFDLPDQGFFFPGDVIHYYIKAGDDLGGDIQYATAPADLSQFSDFSNPEAYSSMYTVHALPTINKVGGVLSQPSILFWNDFANRGGENEWYSSFNNLGLTAGLDYDIYYTNGPSSGVGNGIGGRTSGLAMAGYEDLVYTAGNLGAYTLSNGDFTADAGNDIATLNNWLAGGNKGMFLTGDNLANDLVANEGPSGLAFAENVMGINTLSKDVRSLIGNQATPMVAITASNPVFTSLSNWIAYGGCFGINTFDAVQTRSGVVRLAEFEDPAGNTGAYSYSAATLSFSGTNKIISMPYDFMYVYTAPGGTELLSGRTLVLRDVLGYFGIVGDTGAVSGTDLPETKFAVANYPNPFNPSTKIAYTIKRPGNMTLKVFNVRGELVKTLIDGHVESSNFVMWDGTNNQGSNVSSGVYFYEARMGSDVQVNKMALVK